ncbi:hypothetical protein [Pedobacter soli]|uniref:Uncharacterized protein n=1 Tax=Pedobacter soli TaxID=390242 RepID=A0A1G6XYV4_9SPHI|nr:hypothetical protein [Pedobacter soli]SDD83404.1 hypothetical protein SAMN04488024_10895 [Pedobacter soli]
MERLTNKCSIYTRKTLIYCIILLVINACQNKPDKVEKNNIKQTAMGLTKDEINEIKQHIEYQKRLVSDGDEEDPEAPYELTAKDLNLASKVLLEGLKNNGFKPVTDEIFYQRINEIFGIENLKSKHYRIHSTTDYITLFGLQYKSYEDLLKGEMDFFSYNENYFLMRKEHLITDFQTLDDLIKINDDGTYKTTVDLHNVHRNKYIFNNDKASLAWLLNNEKHFLFTLLNDFGYDKDSKINKMVLDSLYKENTRVNPVIGQYIANLFFVKDCNNKLEIRKGLLKYVEENTSATDNRFIYALGYFIFTLYDGDSKDDSYKIFDEDPSKKFTAVEKAEIVANIANIENPAIEKYKSLESADVWNNAGSSLYNISVSHPEVIKIIEQHNYFGLPKMKAIIAKLQEEAPPTGADPE